VYPSETHQFKERYMSHDGLTDAQRSVLTKLAVENGALKKCPSCGLVSAGILETKKGPGPAATAGLRTESAAYAARQYEQYADTFESADDIMHKMFDLLGQYREVKCAC
jgi:hypothetical protein